MAAEKDDQEYEDADEYDDEDIVQNDDNAIPMQFGKGRGAVNESNGDKKLSNILPIYGDQKTMNMNDLVLKNILCSPYFKTLLKFTFADMMQEIKHQVKHLEPWEKGSRKQTNNWGMCGGVRGVSSGGVVSSAFNILYKLFGLKLTRKQVITLIECPDCSYARGIGFLYIRYTQPPQDFLYWFDGYWDDDDSMDVKAGGGKIMSIGEIIRQLVTKIEWFGTFFARLPIQIQKTMNEKVKEYEREQRQVDYERDVKRRCEQMEEQESTSRSDRRERRDNEDDDRHRDRERERERDARRERDRGERSSERQTTREWDRGKERGRSYREWEHDRHERSRREQRRTDRRWSPTMDTWRRRSRSPPSSRHRRPDRDEPKMSTEEREQLEILNKIAQRKQAENEQKVEIGRSRKKFTPFI